MSPRESRKRPAPRGSSSRPAPWKLVLWPVLVAVVVVAAAVGWRPALYRTGLWVDGGASTVSPTFFEPSSSISPEVARSVEHGGGVVPSAAPATPSGSIDRARLAEALAAVPAKGVGATSGVVLDAASGEVLWQKNQAAALIPASTMKLLTCLAALDVLGPEATFATTVVEPAKGSIVLVGGGDPYLASKPAKQYPHPASSQELARTTAAALKEAGTASVTLGYDDGLFVGPDWHPSWPAGYVDQVSHISSLWIDKGRPDEKSAPSPTPAPVAAQVFAAQLKAQGITVTGKPTRRPVTGSPTELARVESLPLSTLVQETLVHSDNSAAEVLLRQVGVATAKDGSFGGGAKGLRQSLEGLEIDTTGLVLADGSGLSRSNRVNAQVLAGALHAAASTPELRPLLEGLPVAGVTGTLHQRFYTPGSEAGRGWVNAKTGTLSKVSTLAGHTRTSKGGDVVFAFMSNNPTQEWGVRSWLDQMSATVATCDC